MMKTCLMKTALLAMLAGVTLSAGAKPAEVKPWSNPVLTERQSAPLVVARGLASAVVAPRVDKPISGATPTQGG
jgi:hypothetical protein